MKHVAWVACVVGLAILSGCVSQSKYDALLAQNRIQSAKIKGLERDLDQARIEAGALRGQLGAHQTARDASSRLVAAKEAQLGVLEARCADLQARVKELILQMANAGPQRPDSIPKPVSDALKELAEREPSLEFDPKSGTCKFSSDILFDTGDDTVKQNAREVLKRFAAIFTGVGKGLHLRIEGHTDDRRIAKTITKKKHPTNWHLSVHRAISVLRELYREGIDEERMCAAGYGKWQPLVQNSSSANRTRNRRVEIYVVTPPPAFDTDKVATAEPTVMGGE